MAVRNGGGAGRGRGVPLPVACADNDVRAIEGAEVDARAPPPAEIRRVVQREQELLVALPTALLHQNVQRARARACNG